MVRGRGVGEMKSLGYMLAKYCRASWHDCLGSRGSATWSRSTRCTHRLRPFRTSPESIASHAWSAAAKHDFQSRKPLATHAFPPHITSVPQALSFRLHMSAPSQQHAYLIVQEIYPPPNVLPQGRQVIHECISHSLDSARAMLQDFLGVLATLHSGWSWAPAQHWEDRGDVVEGYVIVDAARCWRRSIFVERILKIEECVVVEEVMNGGGAGVRVEG